ncbi:MAG: hypothetical protein ACIALR_05950, partial [Blastopirellula sp. JB062]
MGSFVIITEEPYLPGWISRNLFGATPRPRPPRPEETHDLAIAADRIVRCFIDHGYLEEPVESLTHSPQETHATKTLFTETGDRRVWADPSIDWHHLTIEPRYLQPEIESLLTPVTKENIGLQGESHNPDEPVAPSLDIHLFSAPVVLYDRIHTAKVGNPWAIIE